MRSSARAATLHAANTIAATASQAIAARAAIANVESSSWATVFSYLLITVDASFNTFFGHKTGFLYGNRANVRFSAPVLEGAS
jgi:hypothetical protein